MPRVKPRVRPRNCPKRRHFVHFFFMFWFSIKWHCLAYKIGKSNKNPMLCLPLRFTPLQKTLLSLIHKPLSLFYPSFSSRLDATVLKSYSSFLAISTLISSPTSLDHLLMKKEKKSKKMIMMMNFLIIGCDKCSWHGGMCQRIWCHRLSKLNVGWGWGCRRWLVKSRRCKVVLWGGYVLLVSASKDCPLSAGC